MAETVPTASIQTEEELVPTAKIVEERIRPSNPFKQAVAGITDIGTGIPTLLGLGGAGIEAGVSTLFNDKGIKQNFAEAMESGWDRSLLDAGLGGRDAVNKFLGIKEAVSTEDQAARLIASLIPIPGLGVIGGASKLARVSRGIGNILTPVVKAGPKGNRFNKGFALRSGAQFAIGTGIDQALRGLSDNPEFPTLFSERAMQGKVVPTKLIDGEGQDDLVGEAGEDTLIGTSIGDIVSTEDISEESPEELVPTVEIEVQKPGPIKALEEANQAVEDQETSNLLRNTALTTAGILTVFLGAKYSAKLAASKALTVSGLSPVEKSSGLANAIDTVTSAATNAPEPGVLPSVKAGVKAAKRLRGKFLERAQGLIMDKTKHSEVHLRSVGESEESIKQITGQEIVDPFGVVEQFLKDGKFGQGSAVIVRSLKSIRREYDGLAPEQQQEFLDGLAFLREDAIRTRATAFDALGKDADGRIVGLGEAFERGTINDLELILKEQEALVLAVRGTEKRVTPGLFNIVGDKKFFIADPTIKAGIKAFKANPQFVKMQKDLVKINDAVLEESVRRGATDEIWAKAVRQMFTKDGQLMYLPGKEHVARAAWYKRLATSMGIHSTTGKILRGVSNWHLQGLVEGQGIQSPLDAFQATANYALQVMEHTNRSVQQWNILSRLAGVTFKKNGELEVVPPRHADTLEATRYVGSSSMDDPLNQGGNVHVKFNVDDPKIVERFDVKGKGTFTPQALAEMDDVLWVQRGSAWHGFLVTDRQLKKGLEFDAGLHNRVLQFGNFWKNLFTKFTTGNFSPFGITSFIYNNQISSFNALLRASRGEGATLGSATREAFETWKDSYKGAYEVFAARIAEDYADILARSIQNNTAFYRANPALVRNLRAILVRKTRRTLVGPIQRETGASASGLGASEFQGNLTNIMDNAIPHVSKVYGAGALPQLWRVWNHLNTAFHEGTAMGITMRRSHAASLKNPKASMSNLRRQAKKDASDIVGDVRLRGSSDIAKAFHAVTPFSGAMMQAWSTMGRAMSKAGLARSMAGVTAAIGIPTMLEVTYNSSLDGEEVFPDPSGNGKLWNYREYYWKGFTADQRNNNHIIFVPGKAPWEAVLIPVTPELSLFRGLVIDAMETIFGLSEHGIEEGNHLLASATRVLDIPLNPFLAAIATGLGLDVRAGFLPDDTEGKGFSFLEGRQLFTGRRIGTFARARFEGSELDKDTINLFQDILGPAGTAVVGFYEGFNAGDEKTSLGTRLSFAMDELGRNVKRQVRIVQPFLGKALRKTIDRNIARDLLGKKSALQGAAKRLEAITSGGTISGGKAIRGNTGDFTADPVAQMLSASAKDFLSKAAPLDGPIADLREQIRQIGTATIDPFTGETLTVERRDDLIDSMNVRIEAYMSQQLSIFKKLEELFAENVKNQVGVDISGFEFNNYQPRATPSRLASPGLRRPPQTSQ